MWAEHDAFIVLFTQAWMSRDWGPCWEVENQKVKQASWGHCLLLEDTSAFLACTSWINVCVIFLNELRPAGMKTLRPFFLMGIVTGYKSHSVQNSEPVGN